MIKEYTIVFKLIADPDDYKKRYGGSIDTNFKTTFSTMEILMTKMIAKDDKVTKVKVDYKDKVVKP